MELELIAIGNEVLSGITVNTNSTFLSAELVQKGWPVSRHTVLPDEPILLQEGLRDALKRSHVVIATGGLGPTGDDITRSAAAALFQSSFYFEEKIAEDLARRFGPDLVSLKDQATIPSNAQFILNRVGTAPGLIFKHAEHVLILLPGVPQEMRPMFLEGVIPYLEKQYPVKSKEVRASYHVCLLPESVVDSFLQELIKDYPEVEYGIYPAYATLSVTIYSKNKEQFRHFTKRFEEKYETKIYASSSGRVGEALHALLRERKKTLAFAESCTGGRMAAEITAFSGASDFFLGSLITYSNALKKSLLGVSETTLASHGAVSREAVEEMLQGIFKATSADYAIAVSGIAGPTGGLPSKPVGTIWAAIGEKGQKPFLGTFFSKGNRETIILSTSNRLLAYLWRKLTHDIDPFS